MGFAEWKCHIHNHNHVVELLLPTTEITEHLLKNVVLILLKSSRLHSLQEILDPCLKTGVQLLCIKCIKSKCMLSLDLGSYNWGLFSAHLCEFPQGTRRQEYRLCVLVYGLVSGYSYWEGKKMTPQQKEYTPNWELFEGSFWKKSHCWGLEKGDRDNSLVIFKQATSNFFMLCQSHVLIYCC